MTLARTGLGLVFLLCFSQLAQARDSGFYSLAGQRQTQKEAQRWSLSQWLEQKKNMQLMDTWLLFNPPSPYEFFFSVDTSSLKQEIIDSFQQEQSQDFRNWRGSFGAFVSLVGLYGEYEDSSEGLQQWKAQFMLRALGSSDQSTHLTLHYGLMNQTWQSDATQYQALGARANLYIIDAFALTGLYEHYFPETSEQGLESEGFRYEAGAHIEFGSLRVYGTWFQERLEYSQTSPTDLRARERRGILFGLRQYF